MSQPKQDAPSPPRAWERITGADRLALPLTIAVLAFCTVPRLPPGVCFDDAGDLQTAAATLGIAHPPGYAGFVSIGHLLTWLPGLSPAYAVSLACLAAGLTALALVGLLQIRLGTSAWVAAALVLLLASHPEFWVNLVIPEVYAPALAFEAGAIYLFLRYLNRRRRRDLLLAALLLGFACANRPPIVLTLPVFALALWIERLRRRAKWRDVVRNAALAAGCFLLPCLYSCAYLYVHDAPTTPYNYIDQYNLEHGTLPPTAAGARAKVERLTWLITGRQFGGLLKTDPAGADARRHWLTTRLGLGHDLLFIPAALAFAVGLVLTNRRSSGSALVLAGMALAAGFFVFAYRVYGTAADVLPILFALTVFVGVALSPLFPTQLTQHRRMLAVGLFLAACVWSIQHAQRRPGAAGHADATDYIETVDLATLPANATILTAWPRSTALRYARIVLTHRDDVRIITAAPPRWMSLIEDRARTGTAGPFYTTQRITPPAGVRVTPFRNLWRIDLPPP